jgi:hypothetical protein
MARQPSTIAIAPEQFLALGSPDVTARRETLRALSAGPFRARRHVALLVGSCLATMAASLAFVRAPRLRDLPAVLAAVVFANLVEWAAHRWLLHGARRSPLEAVHASHHLYCPAAAMRVASAADLAWVFMPVRVVLAVAAILLPLSLALAWIASANAAALFAATGFGYFLLYEILHALFHAPVGARIADARWVRRLARGHTRHHGAAEGDFNIFWPLADRCLATSGRRGATASRADDAR